MKAHINILNQISNSIKSKFEEVFLGTKRYKRGILNGIGTIFKSITGNLDASDGEYYSNCINKLHNDEYQLENLIKNQISVTTSVIKNFNSTIQKLHIDEQTFNKNIKEIENSIITITDEIDLVNVKFKFLSICEELMESYLFIEDNLNDVLNSITFARLKIIHSSIITPGDLILSLQEISQNLHKNSLPLPVKSSKIAQYLDIIELEAYQTNSDLVFVLKIPLIDPQSYTLYRLYPIPILDNRTGLHHILSVTNKYIAKDDDSLMYVPVPNPNVCKPLHFGTKLCSNLFAYPIDNDAACEARLFRNLKSLPENCQTSLLFSKGYNVQELEADMWLIIISEALQITINCPKRSSVTELIFKNSILKLQPGCSSFIGITKVQASSKDISESNQNPHPVLIPYDCCTDLPDKPKLPNLKPLKLNNLNVEELEVAKHKLDQYSRDLDDIINQPFVQKHNSWFTYFTITIIICLVIIYITCKCRRKRRLAIGTSGDYPSSGPGRNFRKLAGLLPRRRPSIHVEEQAEDIELN